MIHSSGKEIPVFSHLGKPKAAFYYAAFVGASSKKNLKICGQIFPECPMDGEEIIRSLKSHRKADLPS